MSESSSPARNHQPTRIEIPTLVRVKPGALDRLGIYAGRFGFRRAALLVSEGLVPALVERARRSLVEHGVEIVAESAVPDASFESATSRFAALPTGADALFGLGGGKALDVAKYVAFLGRRPFVAVPLSLSNDGFSSPQSSLTVGGRRRSLPAATPFGVVVDTEVCQAAPKVLWLSGVGDLVAKLTAIFDWKLAFHRTGEPINDFAALLSDATVRQFLSQPAFDAEGTRLLATGLLLNGLAMAVAGSSRPASGAEHLISHALDHLSARPRLHGLQVGVATYLVSRLQRHESETIGRALAAVGFWPAIAADPFSRREWLEAVRQAPGVKANFHTILNERDVLPEVEELLKADERLAPVFVD